MTFKVDSVEYTHERAIATQQTGFSFVAQLRNDVAPNSAASSGSEPTTPIRAFTSPCSAVCARLLPSSPMAT